MQKCIEGLCHKYLIDHFFFFGFFGVTVPAEAAEDGNAGAALLDLGLFFFNLSGFLNDILSPPIIVIPQ